MGSIQLKNVSKTFENGEIAVNNLNLEIKDGSFTVLVGPSGCGKTTILRMISGFESPSKGDIYINGHRVNDIKPRDRNIAMVFQNYALYPNMTVKKNIEFGLINLGVNKKERQLLIEEVTEIVNLQEHLHKKPSQLSGGQRQRVALARALVKKPDIFILDEPLSNLDAKLRSDMRAQLIELHKILQTTFVYVTHDQVEAMSLATEVVLLKKGQLMQHSTPEDLYSSPVNLFSAMFIGSPSMNTIEFEKVKNIQQLNQIVPLGTKVIGFRPEACALVQEGKQDSINFPVDFQFSEKLGSETIHSVKFKDITFKVKDFSNHIITQENDLNLWVCPENLYFFDEEGKGLGGK